MDWDTTRVIDARIGDHVAVARRQRGGQTWFVGAITDGERRNRRPALVLDAGQAVRGRDLCRWPESELDGQSLLIAITRRPVTSATRLRVVLAPEDGQAIRIRPVR